MSWTLSFLVFAGALCGMFVAARVLAWVVGLIALYKDTGFSERRVSLAVPLVLHSGPWALAASIGGLYYASRLAEPSWFWAILGGFALSAVLLAVAMALGMRTRVQSPPPLSPERLLVIRRRFFLTVSLGYGGSQAAFLLWSGVVGLIEQDLVLVLFVIAVCLGGGYVVAWFMWQWYEAKLLSREEMRRQLERDASM